MQKCIPSVSDIIEIRPCHPVEWRLPQELNLANSQTKHFINQHVLPTLNKMGHQRKDEKYMAYI